ncbi:MAG: DNA methyltransferase [Gammaproteobacteria bacterium]
MKSRNPNNIRDWEFRGADTRRLTHGIHSYPAMMIPQIAGRLIADYGGGAKLLFDPYCGTGSSLLEANIRGINAAGADLNPLARLIARVKTTRLDCGRTAAHLRDLHDKLSVARFAGASAPPPPIKNMNFWFGEETRDALAAARGLIFAVADADIRRFFLVAFSETVRECSYTRNGEFKMYRMTAAQREKFSPDMFGVLTAKLACNFAGMQKYAAEIKRPDKTRVFDFDSAAEIPRALPPECADIIVTSPPYGDSRTTVAYGQFSRLANEWLEYENAAAVDRKLLGGRPSKNAASLGCGKLDDAVGRVGETHPLRAREIRGFYEEYRRAAAHVARILKPGGFACYVVGNRKSKGVVLPTDEATKAYFCENEFRVAAAFARDIPNKRMPSRNSPSNVAGARDDTMQREHIIVMQKRRQSASSARVVLSSRRNFTARRELKN